MSNKSYFEKLKDPRWQKLRLEVMQKADFSCEKCFDSESTLNVHHKIYWHGREPWEYDSCELACLCESCHEEIHHGFDLFKWISIFLQYDGPYNRDDAAFLIAGFLSIPYGEVLFKSEFHDLAHFRALYAIGKQARDL